MHRRRRAGDRSGGRARRPGMRPLALTAMLAAAVLLIEAGGGSARSVGGTPVALVTAETADELLAVRLPDGKVLKRVGIQDPQTVAATPNGPVVVVSPRGTVTLLAWRTLARLAILRGFRSPQLAAITPDGEWAYVTDAATGDLSVIDLQTRRVVDRVHVGADAHHLAVSPDFRRCWVALGEDASTIVVLDTSRADRPRVVGRLHPAVAAHSFAFAPDGKRVWVTSASAPYVSVLSARSGRVLDRIPAGPAPQHLAFLPFGKPRVAITSGYGSTLEIVDANADQVLRRIAVPYGSFNIAASGGILATASLLDGKLTELDATTLRPVLERTLAPATRDVAIAVWP
jgi:YVTN family beta-propeller protein